MVSGGVGRKRGLERMGVWGMLELSEKKGGMDVLLRALCESLHCENTIENWNLKISELRKPALDK